MIAGLSRNLLNRRVRSLVLLCLLLSLLVAGAYFGGSWRAGIADREFRAELLLSAKSLSRAINPERAEALSFSQADLNQPEFQRLRQQLRDFGGFSDYLGIYTLSLRRGLLVHGPASYEEGRPRAASPGDKFLRTELIDQVYTLFWSQRPFVVGPIHDERGVTFSVFDFVSNRRTGETLLVVMLDVDGTSWRKSLFRARLEALLAMALLAAIILGGFFLVHLRDRRLESRPENRRLWAEAASVALFFLALTTLAALLLHEKDIRFRREIFRQLSEAKTAIIQDAFHDLRNHKLDALARFVAGSRQVEREEFHTFASPLIRRLKIQALGWIEPVSAARRPQREARARREGLSDFKIWQSAASGGNIPAAGRSLYYPLWYVEPFAENWGAAGFDLGADPAGREIIDKAIQTGLPQATSEIPHPFGAGKAAVPGLVMVQPVFSGAPPNRALRGLVMASLAIKPFLQSALPLGRLQDAPMLLEMYELKAGKAPRFLADYFGQKSQPANWEIPAAFGKKFDSRSFYPLFVFGRTYLLAASPSPAFLAAHPLRAGGIAMLIGLSLTALLTVITATTINRRARLEREVLARLQELRASEERYRELVENVHDMICTHDLSGNILSVNRAGAKALGYEPGDHAGKNIRDFLVPEVRHLLDEYLETIGREGFVQGLMLLQTSKGERRVWEYRNSLRTEGLPAPLVHGVARDITERRRAEEKLKASEERLTQIIEFLPDATFAIDSQGRVTAWNRAMEELTGVAAREILGRGDYAYAVPFYGQPRPVTIDLLRENNQEWTSKYLYFRQEGPKVVSEVFFPDFRGRGPTWFRNAACLLYDAAGKDVGAIESIRDITAQRLAEEEHERLEAQFRQAQKMEAVGRLAGGVAHDFNNMLGVILGQAELIAMKFASYRELLPHVQEIEKAGRRSADLVRQLLAFARKQHISPRLLDLNDTVEGTLKMLRRLIGEHIELLWKPAADLWKVKMDATQVDQILANLVVNARDAIRGEGKIVIETENVQFDEAYGRLHPGVVPGRYVLLEVTDNGCGMNREVMANLFEPFFTTKKVGEGTGLGLATVYGIVKQNNGFIDVESTPGQGSSFKIYLPQEGSSPVPLAEVPQVMDIPGGTETVLLVEDERTLLEIGEAMLRHLGYRTLVASGPNQALALAQRCTNEIHLLITDVIMPEMNGRELQKRILAHRPGIKTLFMSGYTADVIAEYGVLEEGISFLNKPFNLQELARKIRQALAG